MDVRVQREQGHGSGLGVSLIVALFVIWIAAAAGGWPAPVTLGLGAAAVAIAGGVAARIGAFDRETARGYARSVTTFAYALARWPKGLASAFAVVASACGVRRARAGYVRLKLETGNHNALADVIEALSAKPGVIVVDADAGSVLAHAFDEEAVDVAQLKTIERRAAGVVTAAAR
ncbi:MAG: Na+/H+ antiporter subunit E [Alphaproteobacteria bacterium]|nr:Na+/H+ antiporter subunit E [Alphaproteobacteria bacterium]